MEDWLEDDKDEQPKKNKGSHRVTGICNNDTLRKMEKDLVSEVKDKLKVKKKISKDEQLRLAAVGTKKITGWLQKMTQEWDDDPDLPMLEDMELIEKRELEQRTEKWSRRLWMK